MKILHISDLHLGHNFHTYDRTKEQESCLRQIESIIRDRQPDAYVVSGDIYHTTSPQTGAQEMLIRHLMNAHTLAPDMRIVVTAGNHDSNKIEINDPLWNLVGVSVIASIRRNIIDGEVSAKYHESLFARHIIPVERGGSTIGHILAIPHCYPGNFPSVKENLPREERQKAFMSLLLEEVARRNLSNLPVVVMAHTAVRRQDGRDPDALGQDLDIIGGIDMIHEEDLGTGYDYVALGHIHCPQNISSRIRYCGSPLPISFDEDFQHSVSLVSIDSHGAEPQVETIDIANDMPVVTIPKQDRGKRSELKSLTWEEARKAFEQMDPDMECYVRLNVKDDGTIPVEAKDIAAKIPERCGLKAKFCLVNRVKKSSPDAGTSTEKVSISTAELGRMTPYSVAELFLKETGNEGLDPQILSLLKETINEVESEDKEA